MPFDGCTDDWDGRPGRRWYVVYQCAEERPRDRGYRRYQVDVMTAGGERAFEFVCLFAINMPHAYSQAVDILGLPR